MAGRWTPSSRCESICSTRTGARQNRAVSMVRKTVNCKSSADLASNDTPGLWRITVRELASGIEHNAYVRVGS
jgi:hypothetical protein